VHQALWYKSDVIVCSILFLHQNEYHDLTYRTTVVLLMRCVVTDALIHQELAEEDRVCDILLKCVIASNREHCSDDLSDEGTARERWQAVSITDLLESFTFSYP